jgi:hypothetical protein
MSVRHENHCVMIAEFQIFANIILKTNNLGQEYQNRK